MIYILEDDNSIRELVAYTLNNSGLKAEGYARPSDFWHALAITQPELVLLDIMLPEQDGIEILKKLRLSSATRRLPVILLTAKGSEYDKVIGLDSGADDYIQKPFGMMELVARVKALLRRTRDDKPECEYRLGKLYLNPARHVVKVGEETVSLTLKEFEMLCLFIENRDRVFTRDQLLSRIWGYSFDGESRTVDVHIRSLRTKLGEMGDIIETVRGVGYKVSGE